VFIRKTEYALLQEQKEDALKQAEYWRKEFERERARADRLTENLLMTNGLPAASPKEVDGGQDHPSPTRIKEYMAELFEEQIKDEADEESEVAEVEN